MNQHEKIDVKVIAFNDLFEADDKISIPAYQRPYVWGSTKAAELLTDWQDFFKLAHAESQYYLGTVLLFRKSENELEIIDGQQRITTLLIIKYILEGNLQQAANIAFNSNQSRKSIKEAYLYFLENKGELKEFGVDILSRISLTRIITTSEDDAFTFFDTQNNRGVRLGATDYLKAFHLRAMQGKEDLQEVCAVSWEALATMKTPEENELISFLFEKMLWRGREWRGQTVNIENMQAILRTFQKDVLGGTANSYPVYAGLSNRRVLAQSWEAENEAAICLPVLADSHVLKSVVDLPFSLRQPLHKGVNFFKYTEKYAAVYAHLFTERSPGNEIAEVRYFLGAIYTNDMSVYLRHFIQLCLVCYYDSFGENQILRAANCFDYIIGAIRLRKKVVKKEAVLICLTDESRNLLDVITQAYLPEEVFDFADNLERAANVYKSDDIPQSTGVQGRYIKRLIDYFKRPDNNLKNRIQWL